MNSNLSAAWSSSDLSLQATSVGPTRLFFALGDKQHELTTEEALDLAQKLLELATKKALEEGARVKRSPSSFSGSPDRRF